MEESEEEERKKIKGREWRKRGKREMEKRGGDFVLRQDENSISKKLLDSSQLAGYLP